MLTAEVHVETLDGHKLAVAIDLYDGLRAPDGWLDELLVFVSEDPLDAFAYRGLGLLRIGERDATVVLPDARQTLLLSLSDTPSPELSAAQEGFERRVLDRGVALVTHRPAARETLPQALANEARRQRVRGAAASQPRRITGFQIEEENKDDGSSGETCRSSCSATCTDESRCSTSCNSGQCAECDCPASCYCRTRS